MKNNKKRNKIAIGIISTFLWGLGWVIIVGYAVGGAESVWSIIRPSISLLLLVFLVWVDNNENNGNNTKWNECKSEFGEQIL